MLKCKKVPPGHSAILVEGETVNQAGYSLPKWLRLSHSLEGKAWPQPRRSGYISALRMKSNSRIRSPLRICLDIQVLVYNDLSMQVIGNLADSASKTSLGLSFELKDRAGQFSAFGASHWKP